MKKTYLFIGILFFVHTSLNAQIWDKINVINKKTNSTTASSAVNILPLTDEELKQLRLDVNNLTTGNLEGRVAGTKGEELAADYIDNRMKQLGLAPPIGKSFKRNFKIPYGKELAKESKMSINGKTILVPYEAIPLSFSTEGTSEQYALINSKEPYSMWLLPLYDNEQQANNKSFNWEESIYQRSMEAIERGAAGLVFYDEYGSNNFPTYNKNTTHLSLDIPVWVVTKKVYDEHFKNMRSIRPIALNTQFRTEYRNAINVAGFINNGAKSTVIIAAHYDGRGKDEKNNIIPGANDNASGVASLLTLAAKIRDAKFTQYNYLFITFSANKLDQLGSKTFVNEPDFKGKAIAYFINIDKVGNLLADNTLNIAGLGTAPNWKGLINRLPQSFTFNKYNLGEFKGDHITFYENKTPFLYFTTQAVSRGTDDISALNFKGLGNITQYIFQIVNTMESEAVPLFTKTKDEAPVIVKTLTAPAASSTVKNVQDVNITSPTQANFVQAKVSLGVTPDIEYTGQGVFITGVSAGKAAAQAGVINGDIIIQMREFPIKTYDDYTLALTKFNKGNRIVIKVNRNGKVVSLPLTFN